MGGIFSAEGLRFSSTCCPAWAIFSCHSQASLRWKSISCDLDDRACSLWVWGWSFQAWENFLVTGLDFAGILCLFSNDSSESLGSELKLVEKFKEEITVKSYILRDNTYICDVYTDMIKNCLAQNHVYHITCYSI